VVLRAEAAVAEAKRLTEINLDWQNRAYGIVRRMYLRAIFEPAGRGAIYPQDAHTAALVTRFRFEACFLSGIVTSSARPCNHTMR
jgi:hypothetical protein